VTQHTATRVIETLMLCGCSRCGKRLVYDHYRLPCVIDALDGTPTPVHCITCARIVEAGRAGEDAALAGKPLCDFRFESEAEREAFEAEYRKALAILGRAT